MKKALLFALAVMMMVSCADQQYLDTKTWEAPAQVTKTSKIDDLMAQAKWGDGGAYLKLAECYKDGLYGTKPDFMTTMTMLSMAREYGGIRNPRVFMNNLPEDDNTRMTYEGMECIDDTDKEKGLEIAERLISKGCADGYTLKAFAFFVQGDSIEAMSMATKAAEQGSSLGKMLQSVIILGKERMKDMPDENTLANLAETIPLFNQFIAEEYIRTMDEHPENETKAARAYLRADENGCLDKRGAQWLLTYMDYGGELPLTENDILRLRKLAQRNQYETPDIGFIEPDNEPWEEAADSVSHEGASTTAEETDM